MTEQEQQTDAVMRFEVMVDGAYQAFSMDMDLQTFTGTETLLIDQHGGDLMSWCTRWGNEKPTGTDIVLLAFLATRRAQIAESGTSSLVWDEFAEAVAPFTLRLPGED